MSINQILPIVLKYEEKGVTERTVQCLMNAGFGSGENDIFVADREGVGNMSRAFNRITRKLWSLFENRMDDFNFYPAKKFIWFLTNVEFPPEMPESLLSCFDQHTAAVHPAFDSHHPHLNSMMPIVNNDVLFVEWTAPMVSVEAWKKIGQLDEKMPYWGMDLDWSYRAREMDYELKVDGRYRLKHTYLTDKAPEKISEIRRELRSLYDASTEERLIEKYGEGWLKKLWTTHPYIAQGRKKIHL